MKKNISPLTRIEGHLKIRVEIENGKVVNAKIIGDMLRGIERVVLNRHYMDPIRITQRVCGLCSEVHGLASCKAIENAIFLKPDENGEKIRDLIVCFNIISDHLLHFYQLTLPDYVDFRVVGGVPSFLFRNLDGVRDVIRDKKVVSRFLDRYLNSFRIRTRICQGIAIVGAKTPFAHAILVGGVSTSIRPDFATFFISLLSEIEKWVNYYKEDVLLLCKRFPHLFEIGRGPNNYLSISHLYCKSGVFIDGLGEEHFDVSQVSEMEPMYGFINCPTYRNVKMELGPLAECMIRKDSLFKEILREVNQERNANSLMGRLIARFVDTYRAFEYAKYLIERIEIKEKNLFWIDPSKKVSGKGFGFVKAPRGALIHYVEIESSKVNFYSIISPSTWNFSAGGAVETALNGCPADNSLLNVGRIIRSFDPCTACSIH
ncbi:MAG: nickel-dependent hydrogenase large subunit [Desulfurobacteriaceae bacterium]